MMNSGVSYDLDYFFHKKGMWITVVIIFAFFTAKSIADKSWMYLGIPLSPLFIYMCIKKPFIFPFGLYVFFVPFDSVSSLAEAGGATLTKILAGLTIMVLLFKGTFEKKLKMPDPAALCWVLFLIWGALSMVWAIEPVHTISRLQTAGGLLILYLVAASYKLHEKEFNIIKNLILGGGIIAAILTIYNFANLDTVERATVNIGKEAADLNELPFNLILPVSICMEMLLNQKMIKRKAVFSVLLGLLVFSIIITGSRGALLGVGIVFIVYILSIRQRITFGTIALIIGIILLSLTPEYFVERWSGALEGGGAGRTSIWAVALKALEKFWLFGAGLNNFPDAYTEFSDYALHWKGLYRGAHNIYFEIFVELGIVGMSLMVLSVIMHYRSIKNFVNRSDSNQVMLKAAVGGILISSCFLGTLWLKSFWLIWMMILMYKAIRAQERMV